MFNEKKQFMVHAYKLNGWLYRAVEYPRLIYKGKKTLCLYLPKEKVSFLKAEEKSHERDKRRCFISKNPNPMLWFFFEDKWFNIIVIFKGDQIHYYVNIASPYFIEEKAIKYIDFDLDIKINHQNEFSVVDQPEFLNNSKKYRYPRDLLEKINESKEEVIEMINGNWFVDLLDAEEISYLQMCIKQVVDDPELELNL